MRRITHNINGITFDLTYIDLIKRGRDSDSHIYIKYNNADTELIFDSPEERQKGYDEILQKMVDAKLVLLYDVDRDIINYSNVISFGDPIFNTNDNIMKFELVFKNGFKGYGYISLNSYDTGDDLETIKIKMQAIYDKLINIWIENKPALYNFMELI